MTPRAEPAHLHAESALLHAEPALLHAEPALVSAEPALVHADGQGERREQGQGRHFDAMAEVYDRARPAYPTEVVDSLGPLAGRDVLELGAGSGLATAALVARGARVTAVEPGAALAALLGRALPEVEVVVAPAETAPLAEAAYDVVLAATALHWMDTAVVLPRVHRALRPGGLLAVWTNVFLPGPDAPRTAFRAQVDEIARAGRARHGGPLHHDTGLPRALRTAERLAELAAGGLFAPRPPVVVPWSVELTTEQVRDLFASFPQWSPEDVDRVAAAAEGCGGRVVEHYRTAVHLADRR